MRLLTAMILLAGCVAAAATASSVRPVPPAIAVNCAVDAVTLVLDPPGRLRVLEYRYDPLKHATPQSTGRVLAAADATSRVVNPGASCTRVKTVKKRELGFAGPWPRTVQSRITCIAPSKAEGIDLQLRPVVDKSRRVIGNRIIISRKTVPTLPPKKPVLVKVAAADGWVTRTGGGVTFDPYLCGRNMYP